MPTNIGVIMDPIGSIKTHKDSTFAMLLEAQSRGWICWYMEMDHLLSRDGKPCAHMQKIELRDKKSDWFSMENKELKPLEDLDVLLMRKDPPFDIEYIYATYILQRAEEAGVLVVNRPSSLRDANEKLFTFWFSQCCTDTLVTREATDIKSFLDEFGDIILKPPGGMGGCSIFRVQKGDPNTNVIIETLTRYGKQFVMVQRYLQEISQGDKRILIIDGKPVPYALARIPAAGESRGNLAAGASSKGMELTERDYWICTQLAPKLKKMGLLFVGIDVIGDYLTEINVTSPTCIRELDALYGLNIAGELMDCIEDKLA